jgi:hypothetical protein
MCAAAGYAAMAYDVSPGGLGTPQGAWPAGAAVSRAPEGRTIITFLHPKCPCTRATVSQLLRTLQGHPDLHLVAVSFVPPEGGRNAGWQEGAYVRAIRQARPDADIVYDAGGAEAVRFGALTSGTVVAYDPQGREMFRGGITDRRGGDGDNPGLRQLDRIVRGGRAGAAATSPVFGCPLVKPQEPRS